MKIAIKREQLPPSSFDELFEDDSLGLLTNVKLKTNKTTTIEKKDDFKELIDFIKKEKRLPNDDFPSELALTVELERVQKEDPDKYQQCLELLGGHFETTLKTKGRKESCANNSQEKITEKRLNTFDDIFTDDSLGLLDDVGQEIDLSFHGTKREFVSRSSSSDGSIAQLVECKDFYKYKKIFDDVKGLLGKGDLGFESVVSGKAWEINIGDFFLVNNIYRLVVDEHSARFVTGHQKEQRRVRIILDNHLEHEPFDQSLNREVRKLKDSKKVIAKTAEGAGFLKQVKEHLQNIRAGDESNIHTGYIYILQSRSTNPAITEFVQSSSLVKIGFSTTSVEERIKNAEKEPTYLEGKVDIVKKYKCFNFDPHNLERLIHAVLNSQRLNVKLKDHTGKLYRPKEWFTVSPATACEVVERIINGTIKYYRLDNVRGRLVLK